MSSAGDANQDPAAAAAAAAAALEIARQSYAAAVLGCMTFGMYIVLVAICLHFLVNRKSRTTGHYITLAYTVLMLAVTIIYFTCASKWSEVEFVESTVNPGEFATLTSGSVLTISKNAASVVNIFLADSLILYRTFVIWQKNVLVIAFPALVYVGSLVSGIGTLYWSSRPDGRFGQTTFVNYGTSFWSISVGFNVLATILITGKLLYHQRQMSRLKQSSEYLSLAAICIESAAIYSISGLIYIPLFAINSPKQFPLAAILGSATVIAPTLIVIRIAMGVAVKDDYNTKATMAIRATGGSGYTGGNLTSPTMAGSTWSQTKSAGSLPTHTAIEQHTVVEFHPMHSVNGKGSQDDAV